MSKYLFILPNFNIGGAERVTQMLVSNIHNKNIDYDLFFLSSNGDINHWKKYNFIVLSNNQIFGLAYLFKKKLSYNYSFTTHYYINYYITILKIFNRIKIDKTIYRESTPFFTRFNFIKKFFLIKLHSFFYKYADKIVFQSERMLNDFNYYITTCQKKEKVIIYNPLETDKIDHYLNDESKLKIDLNNKNYWVSFGRLIPEKGYDILIEAYAKYYSREFLPLYIFGNGIEYKKLSKLIKRFNLQNKVFLKDYHNNPYSIIKNSDGCIISSRIEGFPNILNEMIYLNKNILSTICVPEISNLRFINTCLANDINSLGIGLSKLANHKNAINIFERERDIYLSRLNLNDFFNLIFH